MKININLNVHQQALFNDYLRKHSLRPEEVMKQLIEEFLNDLVLAEVMFEEYQKGNTSGTLNFGDGALEFSVEEK